MPKPDFTDTSPWDPRTRSTDRDLTIEFEIVDQRLPETREPSTCFESRNFPGSSSMANSSSTDQCFNQLTRTFDSELEGEAFLQAENDFDDFYLGKEIEFTYQGTNRKLTLFSLLGQGGMGEVYEARSHDDDGLMAAVKFVKQTAQPEKLLSRFNLESCIMQSLNHPNIVEFYGQGQFGQGQNFIAMELLETSNIVEYANEAALTSEAKLDLFAKVCQAVAECHEKGIVHRDIKPTNVLVQKNRSQTLPKLIDFGVAKIQQTSTVKTGYPGQPETLDNDHLVGTVQYMSPEQVSRHHAVVDERTDIYSLGILLFELITGNPPISGKQLARESLDSLFERISNAPTPSLRQEKLPQDIDDSWVEPLDAVFRLSITPRPEDRYQTVNQFKEDVMAILRGPTAIHTAPQPSRGQGPHRPTNRTRKISRIGFNPFWQTISLSLLALLFFSLGNSLSLTKHEAKQLISGPSAPQHPVDSPVYQALVDQVNPAHESKLQKFSESAAAGILVTKINRDLKRSLLLVPLKPLNWPPGKRTSQTLGPARDFQQQVQHHAIQQFSRVIKKLDSPVVSQVSGLIQRIPGQVLKRCLFPLRPAETCPLTHESPTFPH